MIQKCLLVFLVPFVTTPPRCSNLHLVSPPAVHHVLGGGQPDDEEVQEPGRLLRRLGGEGRLLVAVGDRRGVPGETVTICVVVGIISVCVF